MGQINHDNHFLILKTAKLLWEDTSYIYVTKCYVH